jgi:hypothetical protein
VLKQKVSRSFEIQATLAGLMPPKRLALRYHFHQQHRKKHDNRCIAANCRTHLGRTKLMRPTRVRSTTNGKGHHGQIEFF